MKLFVWDFHGVLEKGTERAAVTVSNIVLGEFGYQERFSAEDGRRLFGQKWYQYFEDLLPHEPHERHMELQEAAFAYDAAHPEILAGVIEATEHAHEVVEEIGRRHHQIVISNTKPEAIGRFIRVVGLEDYFSDGAVVAVDLHIKTTERSKKDILARYLDEHPCNEIVIIGDSPSDMALAEVAGGTRYLYAHPGRPFRACEADYRINDLRKVLAAV
jgi:phosphoglycolate phosphatase-like HAD superfamily hydrolase